MAKQQPLTVVLLVGVVSFLLGAGLVYLLMRGGDEGDGTPEALEPMSNRSAPAAAQTASEGEPEPAQTAAENAIQECLRDLTFIGFQTLEDGSMEGKTLTGLPRQVRDPEVVRVDQSQLGPSDSANGVDWRGGVEIRFAERVIYRTSGDWGDWSDSWAAIRLRRREGQWERVASTADEPLEDYHPLGTQFDDTYGCSR